MFLGCADSFHLVASGCVSEAWLFSAVVATLNPKTLNARTLNPRTPKPSNLNLEPLRWMSRSLTGIMTINQYGSYTRLYRVYGEGRNNWINQKETVVTYEFLGMVTIIFAKRSKYIVPQTDLKAILVAIQIPLLNFSESGCHYDGEDACCCPLDARRALICRPQTVKFNDPLDKRLALLTLRLQLPK